MKTRVDLLLQCICLPIRVYWCPFAVEKFSTLCPPVVVPHHAIIADSRITLPAILVQVAGSTSRSLRRASDLRRSAGCVLQGTPKAPSPTHNQLASYPGRENQRDPLFRQQHTHDFPG